MRIMRDNVGSCENAEINGKRCGPHDPPPARDTKKREPFADRRGGIAGVIHLKTQTKSDNPIPKKNTETAGGIVCT